MRITKNLKDKVAKLLLDHPHLRSSDERLAADIWYFQLIEMGKRPSTMTAMQFLELFSKKELCSYESISRVRRKLQEENPQLRGSNYAARQAHQLDVQNQLGFFK